MNKGFKQIGSFRKHQQP